MGTISQLGKGRIENQKALRQGEGSCRCEEGGGKSSTMSKKKKKERTEGGGQRLLEKVTSDAFKRLKRRSFLSAGLGGESLRPGGPVYRRKTCARFAPVCFLDERKAKQEVLSLLQKGTIEAGKGRDREEVPSVIGGTGG